MPFTPKTLKKLFKSPQNRLSGRNWGNVANDPEDPIFEDWKVPDISTPEKIEKHFPVVVTHDHDDVYKVTWHLQNLKEWRNTRPETWYEFQDYDEYVERRLKYALGSHPNNYRVLPVESPDELFRVEVLRWTRRSTGTRKANSPKKPSPPPVVPMPPVGPMAPAGPMPPMSNNLPKFFLLNDIKEHFPVVWHKNPQNPKLLGIQLHKMKVRGLARNAGIPEREFETQMTARLLRALEQSEGSGAWKVLPSPSRDYVCLLQLLK